MGVYAQIIKTSWDVCTYCALCAFHVIIHGTAEYKFREYRYSILQLHLTTHPRWEGGGEGGGGKHHGPTQSQETYKSPLPIPSPPANLTSLAFIYPSRIPENRKKKMPAWTDVERLRMLLSIIDLLSSSARLPAWPDVANKMGVGYSAEGLRYFLPTLPLCVWF